MCEVVWSSSSKLASTILSGTQNIDSLIAYTAAIACWALDSIKRRCEPDFVANIYGGYYEDAMNHISAIRHEGGIRAQCLNKLTQDLLALGEELLDHYSRRAAA